MDKELKELISNSESVEDKSYWFNIYETMNEDQIYRLRDILKREKDSLSRL